MCRSAQLLFAGLTLALVCSTAIAAEIFVDIESVGGSCNDDSAEASHERPLCSLVAANARVAPGDTVQIRGGTYANTIAPAVSGTSAQRPITYRAFADEDVVITTPSGKPGADLKDRSHIVLEGLRMSRVGSSWVKLDNSHHCVIRDCRMHTAGAWAGVDIANGSTFNRVLRSSFDTSTRHPGDLIHIGSHSHHNLVEDCDFGYAAHVALSVHGKNGPTWNNVVRGNRVRNRWHSAFGAFRGTPNCVFEHNVVLDSGEEQLDNPTYSYSAADRPNHRGIQFGGCTGCIIRNNVFVNIGSNSMSTWGEETAISNARFYHNTIVAAYWGLYQHTSLPDTPTVGNVVKNNIFSRCREAGLYGNVDQGSMDNLYAGNVFDRSTIRWPKIFQQVSALQSSYPAQWSDNLEDAPQFVDAAGHNYRLVSRSSLENKGAWLTTTSQTGDQTTSVAVIDAHYFYDGFGLVEGDTIQLEGQSEHARVLAVDYEARTLEIDRPLTFAKGVGVSLPYQGSRPAPGVVFVRPETDPVENGDARVDDARPQPSPFDAGLPDSPPQPDPEPGWYDPPPAVTDGPSLAGGNGCRYAPGGHPPAWPLALLLLLALLERARSAGDH